MITAGLDLGTGATKGVLLEDGHRLLATGLVPTRGNAVASGRAVLESLAEEANLLPDEVDYLITTGAARYAYPGRHFQVSDITAAGRGAVFLAPDCRHVVDIGSQSSRAIAVNEAGRVERFKMNEKCAAGAGRFVDRCAKYLQIPLDEIGPKALSSSSPRLISSVCAVLAETEIINSVADDVPLPDILMGVYLSLAQRASILMRNVGVRPEVDLVGGLVKSEAMVPALEKTLGVAVHADARGQHAAAIGAALFGYDRLRRLGDGAKAVPAPTGG